MSNYYLAISALIFVLVAIVQLMRILKQWPVQIGPHSVPMSVSWIALTVACLMSIWAVTQLVR